MRFKDITKIDAELQDTFAKFFKEGTSQNASNSGVITGFTASESQADFFEGDNTN
jgi:hypothetical protein